MAATQAPSRLGPPTLLAIALAIALPPLLGRIGLLSSYWSVLLGGAAVYAAAGLSLNLLMGYAGQVSLGHFALLGVGAFTSAIFTAPDRLGLPFMLAVPAAAIAGGLVALVIGLPSLRLRGLYLAVVTIAFSFVMSESVFGWSFISKGSAGVELPRPIANTFFFNRDYDYLAILLFLLVLLWALDANVTRTKLGRAFHGIRASEPVAASFGVDVTRYKLLAFTISGAMAGVAGCMYGHLYQFVNQESFPYEKSLLVVIIVVIGGLGSRAGVLVSAIFYFVFPEILMTIFGESIRGWDLIVGAMLLTYTISQHPGGLAEAVREQRAHKAGDHSKPDPVSEVDDEPPMPKLPELPRPSGLAPRPVEPAGTPLLAARGISVRFGGLQAVNDASLEVHRGLIVGLIGPNGAGKTTMFNAISGALKPDAGTVHLLGHDVSDLPAHARAAAGMGRSFQLIGLARDLSVTENLLLAQHVVAGYSVPEGLSYLGKAPRVEVELRQRAADTIEALGFDRYADTPVKQLSHGQQRIVELGCVLITAPDLVMLDEPSAGMSPGAAENLAVRLRDIRDELGRTVLLIEHNIPLVLDTCDELYVLNAGEVLASGVPGDVVQRDDVIGAYLGEAVTL